MHEPHLDDVTDADGMTPLHHVAIHGTVEALESLLEQGAPLEVRDRWGRTPLMALCAQGIPHFSPAVWETWPQLRVVHPFPLYLQKIGMALLWQAQVNGLAKNGHAPLHSAACHGAADVTQLLLCAGADPAISNLRRYTPLHAAAEHGAIACAELLLSAGAPPDPLDHWGFTPLHGACLAGHLEIAELLIGYGADPMRQVLQDVGPARAGMNAEDLLAAGDPELHMSTRCG